MDYGSATGQDSLPPPLPADPPARTPEVRSTRTARYAGADGAGHPGAVRRGLAQSQQAGLSAMFGLAGSRAPSQPPLAGTPTLAPDSAAMPATTEPRQDEPGIVLRPARPVRPAPATVAQAPPEQPAGQVTDRFAHLPGLSLMAVILTVQ